MSALDFRQASRRSPMPCGICKTRSGRFRVAIAGYPLYDKRVSVRACQRCRREWEAIWNGALDEAPELAVAA